MKKRWSPLWMCWIVVGMVLYLAPNAIAKMEWNIVSEIKLQDKPLDIAVSSDGMTAYILGEETIQIYSMSESNVTDTIPLTGSFSRIALSPDGQTLLLTDTRKKKLSIVQVTPVFDIEIGKSPVIGKADAPVTIFAFMDYQCPYCSAMYPVLEQLLDKYPDQVNLVLKHTPLPMHPSAWPASLAALAANRQGKYRQMTSILFQNFRGLKDASIKQYAEQVGLDMKLYEADIQAPEIRNIVNQDTQDARRFKVRGVPTIFINGKVIRGRSLQDFEQIIQKELGKTK